MPEHAKHYRFDDLTIDCENFCVQKNDSIITLTPRAFDVLIFLLKNAGRAVEKQEIFDAVWKGAFVGDNALTKVIKEIRQAFDDAASEPRYIETIPKRGYRFIAAVESVDSEPEENNPPSIKNRYFSPSKRRALLIAGGIVCGLFILVIGFIVLSEYRSEIIAETTPIDSIAVLPFENATQDPDLEYLSDGLTENIINTLSPFSNLRVLPRSTSFCYKGKVEDPHTIGRVLGVRSVLTGRLSLRNNNFVIQTELIDVARKDQIWGRQYIFGHADLLLSQNQIANELVNHLRLNPSQSQAQKVTQGHAENPEAQKAYLNGLYLYNRAFQQTQNTRYLTADRKAYCERSVVMFQQAITVEPEYAQAFAALSRAFRCLAADSRFSDFHQKAREAALSAIRIDDDNEVGHTVLGWILWYQDWDWEGAEKEFKRAIELNPNGNVEARKGLAFLLSASGRHAEAIRQIEIVETFPETVIDDPWVGYIYKDARQYDLAIEKFKRYKELRPDSVRVLYGLAEVLSLAGRHEEAISELNEAVRLTRGYPFAKMYLGAIYARAGRRDEAIKMLNEYLKLPDPNPILLASTYTFLGDKEQAFFWFEKAYALRHEGILRGIKVTPVWDSLRDDPRYADLVRRTGLQP